MNKQIDNKTIEEMAKIMCDHCNDTKRCTYKICKDCLFIAEALYNAGYRKVDSNKLIATIVVPDEKLEEIKKECLENVEYNIQEISKETAREILQKIAEIHTENIGYTDWLDDTYFGDEFDKIAKRFGLKTKQLKYGVEVE